MAPALTVHNAEIKTATVEVKTLTISGKQATGALAVNGTTAAEEAHRG